MLFQVEDGTTLDVYVGDELCYQFDHDYLSYVYAFLDCSSNTASDSVTLSITAVTQAEALVVSGVILESGSVSSPAVYWYA